jgi:arylsulfatase A-like enzyme
MRVLVLAAPCLRVSYLGCYGCDWVRTPHLDRLAAEGIVFDQHFADSLPPRTSFQGPADTEPNRSWWTGRYAFPADQEARNADADPNLSTILDRSRIDTIRIVSRSRMADAAGTPSLAFPRKRLLAALAEHADVSSLLVWADLPGLAPPWPVLRQRRFRAYFPRENEDDEEVLTPWLNPPHGVINPGEELPIERLQATYAAMLTYFDAQLGKLFQELRTRHWYEDVLLMVTSDRGMGLGEHGFVGTVPSALHEEFVHVPLLMRLPGGAEAGRRVPALTQAVDVYPTLLHALNVPAVDVHGHSLLPLALGEIEKIREYACAGLTSKNGVAFTLRTPQWSILLSAQPTASPPQLYVMPDDRWEVNNVVQHHQDLTQDLEQTLGDFLVATQQPGTLRPPPLLDQIKTPGQLES